MRAKSTQTRFWCAERVWPPQRPWQQPFRTGRSWLRARTHQPTSEPDLKWFSSGRTKPVQPAESCGQNPPKTSGGCYCSILIPVINTRKGTFNNRICRVWTERIFWSAVKLAVFSRVWPVMSRSKVDLWTSKLLACALECWLSTVLPVLHWKPVT